MERLTEEEFNELKIRRENRDGTAERLCSKAYDEICFLRIVVSQLQQENTSLYLRILDGQT